MLKLVKLDFSQGEGVGQSSKSEYFAANKSKNLVYFWFKVVHFWICFDKKGGSDCDPEAIQ